MDYENKNQKEFSKKKCVYYFFTFIAPDDPLYLLPRTVSESKAHYFLWQHSKFYGDNSDHPSGNGLKQAVPTSFLIVYWMGRAFNIF